MRSRRKGSRQAGSASNVIALVLLFAGAILLFLPLIENAFNQVSMNNEIAKVEDLQSAESAESLVEASGNDLRQIRDWLEQYNERVAKGEVSIAADPFSFDEAINAFGSQGLDDGLIGYIEIPAMDCSMPLYLGSTKEHMAKGATVVSGSSAPIGGLSSNCVIAAHRGYGSAAMFRDIEKLSVGDEVYVQSLWERLSYTVVSTKVISPSDSAAVGVQQGRDMVSLLTCHPYGHNYYRYIVECERTNEVDAASLEADSSQPSGKSEGLSLPEIEDWLRIAGGIVLLVSALVLAARIIRGLRE